MGMSHLISVATTSRSQGRVMAMDSSRQRNMSSYRAGQEFAFYFHHMLDDALYSRNCHHFCLLICQELLF